MIATPPPSPVRAAFEALGRPDPSGPPLAERRATLGRLHGAVKARAEEIARAVDADFGGRPRAETMLAEVALALAHLRWTRGRLRGWMRPRRVGLPLEFLGARARVERVPLGRVAILGPWNYPVQLTLLPLAAALAGGDRVLLKPSEHAPRTAALLADLLAPFAEVRVVQGGAEAAAEVAGLPLDGLFFTGSTATGRKVAEAAARNLVPTVLELGGKSPAIWLPDADLAAAARSVMAGKLFSAGQTCVAPDYLMVPRPRLRDAVAALGAAARALHPRPEGGDYASLLREGARERLLGLLEGEEAVPLLDPMPPPPRLGPYAVVDPDPDAPVMRQEIFGPVLPVLPYGRVEDAVAFVNARPVPLALYVHGGAGAEDVVRATRSGGALVNETIVHVAAHTLPFGGAGESGMGAYHGEEGFRAFTRPRAVMVAGRWMPALAGRPPYGSRIERIIRLVLR